ncbi:MAG: hypothetical protein ACFFB0_19300 [Promethearchaeota archaeon]
MYPNNFWQIEFIEILNNKKNLIIKLILPLILTFPLIIPGMALNVKSSFFTLIIIFISTFGSAVRLIQLKENKIIEKLAVLPIKSYRLIFDYLFASVLIDCIKLSIPLILLLIFNLNTFQILALFWVVINFIISIIFANCLGIIVAILASSSGEVHLYSIITVLGISVISGIFFIPLPYFLNIIPLLMPFYYFLNSLKSFWEGTLGFSIFPLIIVIIITFIIFLISSRLFRFK